MNLYHILYQALISDDIKQKESLSNKAKEIILSEDNIDNNFQPHIFKVPSYYELCHIVAPKDLSKRKDFDSDYGLASLIHSIAHIEFSAIDLALDGIYRFAFMPNKYKLDWIDVALDEIRHFNMLNSLLKEMGFKYGDFDVHSGLFDASVNTSKDILDRMAVIPRYFEASGLDVSPQIIKKLHNKRKIPNVAKLIDILNIIYVEEIIHVQKGDIWFKYLCNQEGVDESIKYFEILDRYELLDKHRPHINVKARKEAGFSCSEIKKLGAKECH